MVMTIGSAQQKPAKKKSNTNKVVKPKQHTVAPTQHVTPINSAEKKILPTTIIDRENMPENDNTDQQEVMVTSEFKPSLLVSSKVNFNAVALPTDTTQLPVVYNVPTKNIVLHYQPITLHPLALATNPTSQHWISNNYIKLGYGNYAMPIIQVGLSVSKGAKHLWTLFVDQTSARGNLPFQQYSKTKVTAEYIYKTDKHWELFSKLFYTNNAQYKYGIAATEVPLFTSGDLTQRFNNVGISLGVDNKLPKTSGFIFRPSIATNYFWDNHNANEISFIAQIPLEFRLGKNASIQLPLAYATTTLRVTTPAAKTLTNTLFYICPTFQLHNSLFKLYAGVQPTWDNGTFVVAPNITAAIPINNADDVLQIGWQKSFEPNTYQSLSAQNPFIAAPDRLANTSYNQVYIGMAGVLNKRLTYNSKIIYVQMANKALFVNDTSDLNNQQTFLTIIAPTINAIKLHGELNYKASDKWYLLAAIDGLFVTDVPIYSRAYGILPFQFTSSLKWLPIKALEIKSDLFFWLGAPYIAPKQTAKFAAPAIDLNFGATLNVYKNWAVWVQFANLLNNHYQRWNQYTVLGTQISGGIKYSFKIENKK